MIFFWDYNKMPRPKPSKPKPKPVQKGG
jgi:hypothetical protein